MILNPPQCIFGVFSKKIIRFFVTKWEIEANPNQIQALLMSFPNSIHYVQRLTEWVTALNRFASKLLNKCLLFFKIMRWNKAFESTNKSKLAFYQLKKYLRSPLLLTISNMGKEFTLYLSVWPTAVSAMQIKEEDKVQSPVYYISKVLFEAKNR